MKAGLFIDIGSTYTKSVVVDMDKKEIVACAKSPTTVSTDVTIGVNNAIAEIKKQTGDIEFDVLRACSSAAGGLRMVSCGLVRDLTAEAARQAALSAGAKVIKVYANKLNAHEQAEILEIKPDIMMLAGGTDGGNTEVILHNAKMIAEIPLTFPVIIAGNKSVADEIEEIISASGKQAVQCQNVMPEFGGLNINPAREAIRQVFLDRIIDAKGLHAVQGMVQGDIIPTPASVIDAIQLLARGTKRTLGIGELVAVDIGGATTDIYSATNGCPVMPGAVLKGIPHPATKRSVEGDLGMRWNAHSIVSLVDEEFFAEYAEVSIEKLRATLAKYKENPELLPCDEEEERIDKQLARQAAFIAMTRHAGTVEKIFTPMGENFLQTGKDLSNIEFVIGTGGSIINSPNPKDILSGVEATPKEPFALMPRKPKYILDKKYILSAMGLLSQVDPEMALHIMKKEMVNL
ncbi:MAG: methylaspartate mutase accessory protein GlmL [Oscillospiraceae bacterium]